MFILNEKTIELFCFEKKRLYLIALKFRELRNKHLVLNMMKYWLILSRAGLKKMKSGQFNGNRKLPSCGQCWLI